MSDVKNMGRFKPAFFSDFLFIGQVLVVSQKIWVSNDYFDKYLFESNPFLLKEIAEHLSGLIPEGTEVLAGFEMGGIPIATALSLKAGIPVAFVRKKAKEYGTCKLAEGIDMQGKNICIIEDVVTTGGQILLSGQDLKNCGAVINNVLCVIEREQQGRDNLEISGLTWSRAKKAQVLDANRPKFLTSDSYTLLDLALF